ncbi:MAG: Ig-like domain-containing protein, partial [Candidatus Magasanikbacteria bacterium]|nr:Ig-like domain-containing protein [Candidatus Magasanikbacteria bacterium]
MLGLINKRQIKKLKTVAKGGVFLAVVLCFSVCLFSPMFVQGETDPPVETTVVTPDLDLGMAYAEQIGLPSGNLLSIIANIIRVALGLLGLLAVIIILYGGWLWMTAGGNEEQIGSAKKTLINGAIGLAIILSAYAIVAFIMSFFGIGGGDIGDGDYTLNPPGIMNVVGGGALGDVVKDHYPTRGQEDVPRNTRIAITFAKPLQWESVAMEVVAGEVVKYRLITSTISIGKIVASSTVTGGYIIEPYPGNLEVQAFPIFNDESGNYEIYTIAITPDPNILLGDSEEKISYSVRITNNLKDETGKPIFQNARCRCSSYIWSFTCSTVIDKTPPRVISVFPENGDGAVPRNAKLQIKFNEAIFPNAQDSFTTSGAYYADKSNNPPIVFIKSASSSLPVGSFRIV